MDIKTIVEFPRANPGTFLPRYFVSDMHMGDGSDADDFLLNADLFREFVASVGAENIVTVGDVMELWQCEEGCVENLYCEELAGLAIGVNGNHDLKRGLELPNTLQIGNILIMHGHQGDKWNSKWKFFGRLISKIARLLELLGWKDADNVEAWLLTPPPSQQFSDDVARRYRQMLLENFEIYPGVDTIIWGHTHIASLYEIEEGLLVGNCGTWASTHLPCTAIRATSESVALLEIS